MYIAQGQPCTDTLMHMAMASVLALQTIHTGQIFSVSFLMQCMSRHLFATYLHAGHANDDPSWFWYGFACRVWYPPFTAWKVLGKLLRGRCLFKSASVEFILTIALQHLQ